MKKLLFSVVIVLGLIAVTGCNDEVKPTSKDTKSSKCSSGKCGGDKKAPEAKKCGDGK